MPRCISLDCDATPQFFVARLDRLGSQHVACSQHVGTAASGTIPCIVQPIRDVSIDSFGALLIATAAALSDAGIRV